MSKDNTPPPPRSKLAAITDALARRDNAALLALLDDQGGDANWCDDRGQTLLHFAALRGDEELCEALIFTKGFDAHARNEDGDDDVAVAGYEVRIAPTSTGVYGAWVDIDLDATHSFTGLTADTEYKAQARTYDAAGNRSAVSN